MITGWSLSLLATTLGLYSFWMYGNGNRKAPTLYITAVALWVIYDILFQQWPLLIPCAINLCIQVRNLRCMKQRNLS